MEVSDLTIPDFLRRSKPSTSRRSYSSNRKTTSWTARVKRAKRICAVASRLVEKYNVETDLEKKRRKRLERRLGRQVKKERKKAMGGAKPRPRRRRTTTTKRKRKEKR